MQGHLTHSNSVQTRPDEPSGSSDRTQERKYKAKLRRSRRSIGDWGTTR